MTRSAIFWFAAMIALAVLIGGLLDRLLEPPPLTRQEAREIDAAIHQMHDALCADPRGELADGSCGE